MRDDVRPVVSRGGEPAGATSFSPPDLAAPGAPVRILSTKWDGSPHNDYWGRLLDRRGNAIRVWVEAGTPWTGYRGSGVTRAAMTQLHFLNRGYNVFHNLRPVGQRGILTYANVSTPVTFEGDTLRWVDLDVDVLRLHDGGWVVDDEDEFEEHRVRMGYPDDVVRRVIAARDELLACTRTGAFPLDREHHLPATPAH